MAKPLVGVVVGSDSDLPVIKDACAMLDQLGIAHEVVIASAHRTPDEVEQFAKGAKDRGIKVIIAGAGMAAHLPGVIAAMTPLPVIGVPIRATLEGLDALLAIVQMPPGIPVATVAINGAYNAGILAIQILAQNDETLMNKLVQFKQNLKGKIVKANQDLSGVKYKFKTN